MRLRRAILLLALSTPVAAQGSLAERYLAAHREGNEKAMRAIATGVRTDPFLLADALFWRHVNAATGGKPADHLAAAATLSKHGGARPDAKGLAELVERWRALDEEALQRELALRTRQREILAMLKERRATEAHAALQAVREEREAARTRASFAVQGLLYAEARALWALGRIDDAVLAFREAARAAKQIGWLRGEAHSLAGAGWPDRNRGAFDKAIATWEEECRVRETAGDKAGLAGALQRLGDIHLDTGRARQAEAHYRSGVEAQRAAGGDPGELMERVALALLNSDRYDEALAIFEPRLKKHLAAGRRDVAARVLGNIGVARLYKGEYGKARSACEQALAEFRRAKDAGGVAWMFNALGAVQGELGDKHGALETARQSLEAYRAAGDRRGVAEALGNLASAHSDVGLNDEAVALYRDALKAQREIGARDLVVAALRNMGAVHADLGRFDDALQWYGKAFEEAKAIDDRAGAAWVRRNVATTYARLGRPDEALAILEEVLTFFEKLDAKPRVATLLGDRATVQWQRGEVGLALDDYERALEAVRALGSPEDIALILGNMAGLCTEIGQDRRAAVLHADARKQAKAVGKPGLLGFTLGNYGYFEERQGRPERAVRLYRDAQAQFEAAGDAGSAAWARGNVGGALLTMKRYAEAVPLLEAALEGQRTGGNLYGAASTRIDLGRAQAGLGRLDRAEKLVQAALGEMEEIGSRQGAALAHAALAETRLVAGRRADALVSARRSVELRLALGEGLGEKDALGLRRSAREATDIGLRASVAPQDAFWFAEAGRALVLAEVLANRKAIAAARIDRELREAEVAARSGVEAARARYRAMKTARNPARSALKEARIRMDAAYRLLDDAVARIQRAARRAADVVYPQPIALDALRKTLPERAVLLSYHLTSEQAYVLVVHRADARVVALGDAAALRKRVKKHVRLLWFGADEAASNQALHKALIAPVEDAIARAKLLLVSPDDVLTFLPFEALGSPRLIERVEVAYVPSATVYASLLAETPAAGKGVLAIGDPLYPPELPRLPETAEEVTAIARLFKDGPVRTFLRRQATVTNVTTALGRATKRLRALHFACHGQVDTVRPRRTGLVLGGGESFDLDRVYRLPAAADLVVLSACDTGRGELSGGEGVIGLVRGFLLAGGRQVVVSNWKVGDEATRELMVAFYEAMLKDELPAPAALRAAKRRVARTRPHPRDWAAFVLWGLAR